MRGLTLIELMMAMTITSMLSFVLGGLVMAVQSARDYTQGMEDASMQAQATFERIKRVVADAGVYQVGTDRPKLGIAIVPRQWQLFSLADTLVVWNGGRNGGLGQQGELNRVPNVNEFTVYTPDLQNPSRLLEVTFPGFNYPLDFRNSQFDLGIQLLVASVYAEPALLSDRIRVNRLQITSGGTTLTSPSMGAIHFEIVESPTEAQLSSTTVGSAAWNALPWSQSIVGANFGMRQATVRMELQMQQTAEVASTSLSSAYTPYFGSVSNRYVYQP
jgi:prepilin-type N-terminal cleavage/methylation domain-containing protein